MVTVEQVMMPEPLTLDADRTLPQAAERMRLWDVDELLVVDGARLYGVLTARHIVVAAIASDRHPATVTAGECCDPEHPVVNAHDAARHAAGLMAHHRLPSLPVIDDERRLVGTIWATDLRSPSNRT
jgi:CBS domain-containing protein